MADRTVTVNEQGLWIGEDHPRAKFTNAEVELMRKLRESGMTHKEIAEKFGASPHTVGRICRYERRTGVAAGERKVHIPDGEGQ